MLRLTKYMASSSESLDLNILPKALMGEVLKFDNNYQMTAVILGLTIGVPLVFVVIGIVVYRRRKHL